jgi:hypothetical protein
MAQAAPEEVTDAYVSPVVDYLALASLTLLAVAVTTVLL